MADTVVFAEQTLTFNRADDVAYIDLIPAPFTLAEGEPYRIVLNGAVYEACAFGDRPSILYTVQDNNGNTTSGSFQIAYASEEDCGMAGGAVSIAVWGESDTHTIAIYQKEKAITYTVPSSALKAVADAIRAKTGGTEALAFPNGMVEAICGIQSGLWPKEYQPIECIVTDGNQHIDTGVIPSDYTEGIYYELDFAAAGAGSNNTDYLFGCLSGEGRSGNFGANFDQGNIRLIAGSTSSTATYNWYNIRNRCIARVFATSENPASRSLTFERDGTVTTPTPLISNYESKPMPSESIYLFNCRGISRISCAVTCWGFNMTAADGTPIRNFVPCYRKADNVIGLYDMVEGKFYTNAGTGAFTKGADV